MSSLVACLSTAQSSVEFILLYALNQPDLSLSAQVMPGTDSHCVLKFHLCHVHNVGQVHILSWDRKKTETFNSVRQNLRCFSFKSFLRLRRKINYGFDYEYLIGIWFNFCT